MPNFAHELARFGDNVALIDDQGALTYSDLLEQAGRLSASIGQERQLVFLEATNTRASVIAYVGCLIGAHPVHMFNARDREQVDGLISTYRPNRLITTSGRETQFHSLETERHELHPDLRVLLATSGSTGSPKFVKLSARNIQSNAQAISTYLGLSSQDRAITSVKLAHSFGMSVLTSHLLIGGSLVLTEMSVTDREFWPLFERHSATSFSGVPYTFEMLRRMPPDWARMPTLRYVTQAGGRLAPELVRYFASLGEACGWKFFVMYGQTEAAPRIAYLPPDMAMEHPDCIGIPIPGGEIRILDTDGRPVADGEQGQLGYVGPNIMLGYANSPEDLVTDESPPILMTGDIAVRTCDGLIRIVGRQSRFVKPFGVRVNLDDVQHEARMLAPDAVCTGDDEKIVIAAPAAEAEMLARLPEALSDAFGLPAFIFKPLPLADMPLLSNGKVDMRAILAQASAPQARSEHLSRPDSAGPGSFIRTILSPAFVRQAIYEASQILGFTKPRWSSVAEIYSLLLNRDQISDEATFASLAGDSLTYVQVHLALEDYLGEAPNRWEEMTVSALQRMRTDELAF